jgi:hypothetical protein
MNYNELVAASKAYADRQDIEVDANVDIFILMAEARINRVLKTREQTSRAYAPTVDLQEFYTVPPDYAGMRHVKLNSALSTAEHVETQLHYLTPEQFAIRRGQTYCGTSYYCVIADQIQVYPIIDAGQSIEMTYYQKVPNLSLNNLTNWMSESHPDIYLAGITSEMETFAKNYEVGQSWDARMSRSINELDTVDELERWSGQPLVVRIG